MPPGPAHGSRNAVRWDLVIQVVGAGAALTGWIAVVGGARVWARLYANEIPATYTLSVLPRQQLVAEGLQTLLVPLLLGAGLAIFVYYSRTRSVQELATQEAATSLAPAWHAQAHWRSARAETAGTPSRAETAKSHEAGEDGAATPQVQKK